MHLSGLSFAKILFIIIHKIISLKYEIPTPSYSGQITFQIDIAQRVSVKY